MYRFMLRLAIAFLTFVIGIASAMFAGNIYSSINGFNTSYDSRSKVVQPARVDTEVTPHRGRSCLSHQEMKSGPYAPPARSVR
ncbi:MAG: hypothetical protein H0T92_07505 [Pyrinomonadaceae bacterium]|jgi:hypothetical protein|nr:hypothetical protein [Pyrinomonadaceae bacterium]